MIIVSVHVFFCRSWNILLRLFLFDNKWETSTLPKLFIPFRLEQQIEFSVFLLLSQTDSSSTIHPADHAMSSTPRLLPLHEHEDYRNDVITLLNDEWPQSKTIRLRRLERSCDELPLSYILVDKDGQLIGYCYLDRLFNEDESVIVESVCIQRTLRGKGWRRFR